MGIKMQDVRLGPIDAVKNAYGSCQISDCSSQSEEFTPLFMIIALIVFRAAAGLLARPGAAAPDPGARPRVPRVRAPGGRARVHVSVPRDRM